MKVLVVGGGIGGLSVAALLARTGGHEVAVIERAKEYGEAGYGLGLYPLGAAVFNALGLAGEARERSVTLERYSVHGPDGKVLQEVDLSELLAPYGPMLGIGRADVIDLLHSAVPADTVEFGVRAESVALEQGLPVVTTSDGERLSADVVVAADGMHSSLRRSLFGEVKGHDTGFDAWMWWAPEGSADPRTASEYWGPSAFVGLYPMKQAVNVAIGVPRSVSPDAKASPDAIIAALREVIREHNPGAVDLEGIWEIGGSPPFLWPLEDVRAPELTALEDRVVLLGDSGIGFLPTAGVGASNAMRSAAALAYDLSLGDSGSVPVATRRWKSRIEKLVKGNQRDSRELARVMLVKHGTSSKVINAIMKHAPVTAMTRSIVKSMEAPF